MSAYLLLWGFVMVSGALVLKEDSERRKKLFLILNAIFMCAMQSLRSLNVGADTYTYSVWFMRIRFVGWSYLKYVGVGTLEYGWVLLNKICSLFGDFRVVLFVTSVIIIVSVMIFIYYNSDDVFLSVCLFMGTGHFLTAMSSLRQYIALAFVLNVYTALNKKKYAVAALFAVIAYQFHQSSAIASLIIVLVFALMHLQKKNRGGIYLAIVSVGGSVVFFLTANIQYVMRFIEKYANRYFWFTEVDTGGGGRGRLDVVYLFLEIAVILLVLLKGLRDELLQQYALLLACAAGIVIFQKFIDHLWRLGFYFSIFLIVAVPRVYTLYFKNNRSKRAAWFLIVACSMALCMYYILSSYSIYRYELWDAGFIK